MKTILCISALALLSFPLRAQFASGGLQDGGHGSGGDEKAEYTTAVNPGWNIVSVPIAVGDYLKTSLFPTATSQAFAYQAGYLAVDTLDNGAGYWLKFPSSQILSLNGSLINMDSLAVGTGWNIVGSISNSIPASSVTALGTTIQSSFFAFDNGYQAAGTIDPGRGYWVKVSTAGTLVLSSGGTPVPPQAPVEEYLSSLNSITLLDAAGGRQQLYFASGTDQALERFELPPPPPSGVFDARFASQRMLAVGDDAITLSSASYPVELRWSIVTPGDYALIVDGKETLLNAAGSSQITRAPSRLSLRVGAGAELPKEFALAQNYPNPFNPTTTLRYSLPAGAHVSLKVYNLYGQEVRTLVNGVQEAGYRSVEWDARNDAGASVASGVYFYRLQASPTEGGKGGAFVEARKMVLLR